MVSTPNNATPVMIQNAETAQKLVSAHKAIFTHPPLRVPSDKHVDGPLLGNGDVGVVFAGPPEHLRLLISKFRLLDLVPS